MTEFARVFNLTWAGSDLVAHGVQFPSGRCVVDDPLTGFYRAAISLDALRETLDQDTIFTWERP